MSKDSTPPHHSHSLGEDGEQFVKDAIRSAYDRGYNDARLPLNLPMDNAPGYRGRDMTEEIAVDVLARLRRLPSPQTNTSGSAKWGEQFPPSCCTAWEDCGHDGICHDRQQCQAIGPNDSAVREDDQ